MYGQRRCALSIEIDLATDILPLSDLKVRTEEVVKRAKETGRPMVLTEGGRSIVAVVDIGEFQRLREQAALAQDLVDIVIAERGPFISHEDVKERYGWLFEETADARV
jgi:prevent-host-death family protein